MFDSVVKGTLTEKADAVRAAIAQEFDLHSLDYYTSDSLSRELLPPKDETRQELDHWAVKLYRKGVPEMDIDLVHTALNPVPDERPTAIQLLNIGYH